MTCPCDLTEQRKAPRLAKGVCRKAVQCEKETPCMVTVAQESAQKPLPPKPPSLAGCCLTLGSETKAGSHRDFVQADILDRGPHNRHAADFGGEDVSRIAAVTRVTGEAFRVIRGLSIAVQNLRYLFKRVGL